MTEADSSRVKMTLRYRTRGRLIEHRHRIAGHSSGRSGPWHSLDPARPALSRPVGLAQFSSFHPIADQLAGRITEIRDPRRERAQGGNGALEHGFAAVRVVGVVVVSLSQARHAGAYVESRPTERSSIAMASLLGAASWGNDTLRKYRS